MKFEAFDAESSLHSIAWTLFATDNRGAIIPTPLVFGEGIKVKTATSSHSGCRHGADACCTAFADECAEQQYMVDMSSVHGGTPKGQHKQRFVVRVQVSNHAGLAEAADFSFLIDATAPEPGTVVDTFGSSVHDVDFSATGRWQTNWDHFREPETSIVAYRIDIAKQCPPVGTPLSSHSVVAATRSHATDVTQFGPGLYFAAVYAQNSAGLWSDPACSDGVSYDKSGLKVATMWCSHMFTAPGLISHADVVWSVDQRMRVRRAPQGCSSDAKAVGSLLGFQLEPDAAPGECNLAPWSGEIAQGLSGQVNCSFTLDSHGDEVRSFAMGVSRVGATHVGEESWIVGATTTHGLTTDVVLRDARITNDLQFHLVVEAVKHNGVSTQASFGPVVVDSSSDFVTNVHLEFDGEGSMVLQWEDSHVGLAAQGALTQVQIISGDGGEVVPVFVVTPAVQKRMECSAKPEKEGVFCLSMPTWPATPAENMLGVVQSCSVVGRCAAAKSALIAVPEDLRPDVVIDLAPSLRWPPEGPLPDVGDDVDCHSNQRELTVLLPHVRGSRIHDVQVAVGMTPGGEGVMRLSGASDTVKINDAVPNHLLIRVQHLSLQLGNRYYVTVVVGNNRVVTDGVAIVPSDEPPLDVAFLRDGPGCLHVSPVASVAMAFPSHGSHQVFASESISLVVPRRVHTITASGDALPGSAVVCWGDSCVSLAEEEAFGEGVAGVLQGQLAAPAKPAAITVTLPKSHNRDIHWVLRDCVSDWHTLDYSATFVAATLHVGRAGQAYKTQMASAMWSVEGRQRGSLEYTAIVQPVIAHHLEQPLVHQLAQPLAAGTTVRSRVKLCFSCAGTLIAGASDCVGPTLVSKGFVVASPAAPDAQGATAMVEQSSEGRFNLTVSFSPFSVDATGSGRYSLAASSSPGGELLMEWIDFSKGGGETHVTLATRLSQEATHAVLAGAPLWALVRGYTDAGHWTELSLQASTPRFQRSLVLDQSPDADGDVNFVRTTKTLRASWHGMVAGKEGFQWAVSTTRSFSGCDQPTSLACGTTEDFHAVATNLDLVPGQRFYFCVKSGATVACSDGAVPDLSPPTFNGQVQFLPLTAAARSGGAFQSNRKHVFLTWSGFTDLDEQEESGFGGISHYIVTLGTQPGVADLCAARKFTATNSALLAVDSSLPLGTPIYATVTAFDFVGWTVKGTSLTPLVTDVTPPTPGVVFASFDRPSNSTGTVLLVRLHWTGFADEESGVWAFHWKVTTGAAGGASGVESGDQGATSFALDHVPDGHQLLVSVLAVNNAGLSTQALAGPFRVDLSPPAPRTPFLVFNGKPSSRTAWANLTGLDVGWPPFEERHSTLWGYEVSVTTAMDHESSSGHVLHPWEKVGVALKAQIRGLALAAGERIIVRVRGCNSQGMCSIGELGVTLDDSPPHAGRVRDGIEGADVDVVSSADTVSATWVDFVDMESGVVEYSWWAGSSPGAADVFKRTAVALASSASRHVTLAHGQRVFVTVEAVNPAGLSVRVSSDGFVVDLTEPSVVSQPTFVPIGAPTNLCPTCAPAQPSVSTIKGIWEAEDKESPALHHTWSLQTTEGARVGQMQESAAEPCRPQCSGGHGVGCRASSQGGLLANLRLQDGDRLEFVLSVCNEGGLCRQAHSNVLTIDSTPPGPGWVSDAACTAGGKALFVEWVGFDEPHSDLARATLRVGTEFGLGDVGTTVISDPKVTSGTVPVDGLTRGKAYFVSITKTNAAGLETTADASLTVGDNCDVTLEQHTCTPGGCSSHPLCACHGTYGSCPPDNPRPCKEVSTGFPQASVQVTWMGGSLTGNTGVQPMYDLVGFSAKHVTQFYTEVALEQVVQVRNTRPAASLLPL